MGLLKSVPRETRYTLRSLAHLLRYPDEAQRAHLGELRQALHAEAALDRSRLAEIDQLVDRLVGLPGLESEAAYVDLFDRGRSTSLHLFEHVHGDSRERGQAMIDLTRTYEGAGLLLADGELPDYLPVALEFASTQPPAAAREFLQEVGHILQAIFSALCARNSIYACVLAGLLDLAGAKAAAVPVPAEPDLDDAWDEPAAFDGCRVTGQNSPDQLQPLHFVPRKGSAKSTGAQG